MDSNRERQLFRQNLALSPYLGSVGALLAILLGFWTPCYFSYLIAAAIVSTVGFVILWFGIRRGINLNFIQILLFVSSSMVARELLLPRNLPHEISFRCQLQFFGVWIFIWASLNFVFRKKLKRDAEDL